MYFVDEPKRRFPYSKLKDVRPPQQVSAVQGMATGALPNIGNPVPEPSLSKPSTKRVCSDPFEPFFTDYRRYKQAVISEFESQWGSEDMCHNLHIGSVDVRLRQGEGTALAEDQREQLNALLEKFAALFD